MSEKVFDRLVRGLQEADAYLKGEREGYAVTVPQTVNVRKSSRVCT